MANVTSTAAPERLQLLRVLGPAHVWALGVGIVLVGEYMGWNFSVGKGGMIAGLVACWVAGLLYTCVAMIDSEVTSTVAAAGGQYAQAKHIVGPLMAFNVGLFLVMAYTMLEAANAITVGFLLDTVAGMLGHSGLNQKPFIILAVMFLAWLNYRDVLATLTFNLVITAIAFVSIIVLFLSVQFKFVADPIKALPLLRRANLCHLIAVLLKAAPFRSFSLLCSAFATLVLALPLPRPAFLCRSMPLPFRTWQYNAVA